MDERWEPGYPSMKRELKPVQLRHPATAEAE